MSATATKTEYQRMRKGALEVSARQQDSQTTVPENAVAKGSTWSVGAPAEDLAQAGSRCKDAAAAAELVALQSDGQP